MSSHRAGALSLPTLLLASTVTTALTLSAPADARGQVGVSVELRPGGSLGRYDAARGDDDASVHPAWRVGIALAPLPYVQLVGSYARSPFGCGGGLCTGVDVDFASAGPEVGVRLGAAIGRTGPWVQGDLIAHRIRAAWPGGSEDSDRALGWGVAGGFQIHVGRNLTLSPAVRVQTYHTTMPPETDGYRVSLASAELGLSYRIR